MEFLNKFSHWISSLIFVVHFSQNLFLKSRRQTNLSLCQVVLEYQHLKNPACLADPFPRWRCPNSQTDCLRNHNPNHWRSIARWQSFLSFPSVHAPSSHMSDWRKIVLGSLEGSEVAMRLHHPLCDLQQTLCLLCCFQLLLELRAVDEKESIVRVGLYCRNVCYLACVRARLVEGVCSLEKGVVSPVCWFQGYHALSHAEIVLLL
mmetsp:Transcript_4345/g.16355  ORF Transcript_4345/g.16355 Transcript_4345/m.16355 type:complete len:205 (-) Transcript_4345:2082-2696(-)